MVQLLSSLRPGKINSLAMAQTSVTAPAQPGQGLSPITQSKRCFQIMELDLAWEDGFHHDPTCMAVSLLFFSLLINVDICLTYAFLWFDLRSTAFLFAFRPPVYACICVCVCVCVCVCEWNVVTSMNACLYVSLCLHVV